MEQRVLASSEEVTTGREEFKDPLEGGGKKKGEDHSRGPGA